MNTPRKSIVSVARILVLTTLLAGFALAACSQEPPTPTATAIPAPAVIAPSSTVAPAPSTAAPAPAATSIPAPTPTRAPAPTATSVPPTPTPETVVEPISFDAASANITVDGDLSDWSGITPASVGLTSILPIPGVDFGDLDDVTVDLSVAIDSENIYVLLEVPDDYDYNPEDHHFSPAIGVMLRIDDPAAPHMGTTEEDQDRSLGKVDIWHWELDCPPGSLSGGNDAPSGNDPDCNLDDEWSTTPEEREDDGSVSAENTLVGVWDHTGRSGGNGTAGTWIFEMSRPLQTGDPDDAQLVAGGQANFALAYWDADETAEGWTDAGHIQSSTYGWIQVDLP